MRRFSPLALVLSGLAACSGEDGALRPSLTMVRIGEADVSEEAPVVVPADLYVPGIVVNSEPDDQLPPPMFGPPPAAGTNTDLSFVLDRTDPAPLPEHVSYTLANGVGNVIDNHAEFDLTYEDVQQGAIGDCYLVAAVSAVLYSDHERVVRDGLIQEISDANGKVTGFAVRFYDAWGDPQDVEIDAQLVRKNGRPVYARSLDNATSEEWGISFVEKAYAQWHGGFPKVGDGGWAGDVMQAMTGATATYREISRLSDDSLVKSISDAMTQHRPVVAGTFGEEEEAKYAGTNIYAFHAYTVLGVTGTGAEAKIKLRNPWGQVEPAGNGVDDGIFELSISDFRKFYEGLTLGGSYKKDTTAPSQVTDLKIVEEASGVSVVEFKATGDDGKEGLATRYDVRVSSAPISPSNFYQAAQVAVADPQTPGTVERVSIPTDGGAKYVVVRVEDESGNISPLSNAVQVGVAPVEPVVEPDPVDDIPVADTTFFTFESGEQGWTTSGLFHRSTHWSASPSHAFWMGDEGSGNYATGARVEATLTSPILDLTGASAPAILWEQLIDLEAGTSRDHAVLEVATEGGRFQDWTEVWWRSSVSYQRDLAEASLTSYAGERIRVRFRFDSVDGAENEGEGWFIDDVWFALDW
jgi:hypothetical protein